MKVWLICGLMILVLAAFCFAQDKGSGSKMKDASAGGMAYGSVLVAIIIMIVLPSVGLMLIAKILKLGVEEIGIIRCVYTSILFFAGAGLIFFSGGDLKTGIEDPMQFFKVTELGIRLAIVFVLAVILIKFLLSSTIPRAIGAGILYIAAFYGCTYLSWMIIVQAGAENLLNSSTK